MTPCVAQQAFDTEAFGRPFFRVTRLDAPELEAEIARVRGINAVIIDAKMPAESIEAASRLQRLGFRKVSTQVELVDDTLAADAGDSADVSPRLDLTAGEIERHAANFIFDRFALDIAIEKEGHDRFYRRWIANSLTGGRHGVAHLDGGFATFKLDGHLLKIDLVSVLEKGKGIGRRLLRAINGHALASNCRRIQVVTECENTPAFNLYQRSGFRVARFLSVLHCAEAARAPERPALRERI